MRKINISNLKIKKSISKYTLELIFIDIIFYFFITFGLLIVSFISNKFEIDPTTSSIIWTILFIPILIIKIRKDLIYKKNRRF